MKKIYLFSTLVFCSIFLVSCQNKNQNSVVINTIPKENSFSQDQTATDLFPLFKNIENNTIQWIEWESTPFKVKTELWTETKKYESGIYEVNGAYPIISGFQNKQVEGKVNLWIKEAILEEAKRRSREWITRYTFNFSYKIMLLNESFVSVLFETNIYKGGSHFYNRAKSINIDLKKEKKLSDDELFNSNIHYWETLKPIFKKDFEKQFKGEIVLSDELMEFSIIHPDLSFAFTPDKLAIIYDENGTDSRFSSRVYVFIPLVYISKITPYQGFPNAYSYYSAPKGWEILENRGDIRSDMNQGYLIKFPAIKDKDGNISNLYRINFHDVVISIPFPENKIINRSPDDLQGFDTLKASLQIQWRDIDGSEILTNKTNLPEIKKKNNNDIKGGYWEKEQINGIWFEKESDNEVICYRGILKGTEYLLTITKPNTESNELEELIITRINQILGTFRFY
jgi:hypothetical protein